MEIDPLFKIKQIFGSVDKFEEIIQKTGEEDKSILSKIIVDNITQLSEYRCFVRGSRVDHMASGNIVEAIRDCYKHHLKKETSL